MEENTDKITDKRLENLAPPFKKGETGNPKGRPKGRRNFTTIFYDALEKLAEKNGIPADQLETEIVEKALLSARKGDHRFYKDLMDRLHGTAIQKTDITSQGQQLGVVILPPKNNANTVETTTETGDSTS